MYKQTTELQAAAVRGFYYTIGTSKNTTCHLYVSERSAFQATAAPLAVGMHLSTCTVQRNKHVFMWGWRHEAGSSSTTSGAVEVARHAASLMQLTTDGDLC
jgi:hypothetical protein